MPTELIQILVQIPIVGVFIWYSDRINKQFQEFLKEQRIADREILRQLLTEIKELRHDHEEHDKRVERAVLTMEERTKAR
jgi:ribosome recycling factor